MDAISSFHRGKSQQCSQRYALLRNCCVLSFAPHDFPTCSSCEARIKMLAQGWAERGKRGCCRTPCGIGQYSTCRAVCLHHLPFRDSCTHLFINCWVSRLCWAQLGRYNYGHKTARVFFFFLHSLSDISQSIKPASTIVQGTLWLRLPMPCVWQFPPPTYSL